MVLRLINTKGSDTFHWQIWNEKKQLHIISGKLGVPGTKETVSLGFFESSKGTMKKLAKEKINQGYEYVKEESYTKMVVQYRYEDESQFEAAEKKTLWVEDLLDEVLYLTGNGKLYGSEVGDGAGTTFCLVIDLDLALNTVLEELSKNQVIEGAEIAYENKEGNYIGIYPEGIKFELV